MPGLTFGAFAVTVEVGENFSCGVPRSQQTSADQTLALLGSYYLHLRVLGHVVFQRLPDVFWNSDRERTAKDNSGCGWELNGCTG